MSGNLNVPKQKATTPPIFTLSGVARIRRTDLQRVGRLGVGAFGLVTLEAGEDAAWR